MKRVKLPKKKVTVGSKVYSAEDVIREIVMTRPGWRQAGRVRVAISIEDKLDAGGGTYLFTDMEHDTLSKEAAMQDSGGIAPLEMNRFYLLVLSSIYDAEDVVEDPERAQAAE